MKIFVIIYPCKNRAWKNSQKGKKNDSLGNFISDVDPDLNPDSECGSGYRGIKLKEKLGFINKNPGLEKVSSPLRASFLGSSVRSRSPAKLRGFGGPFPPKFFKGQDLSFLREAVGFGSGGKAIWERWLCRRSKPTNVLSTFFPGLQKSLGFFSQEIIF